MADNLITANYDSDSNQLFDPVRAGRVTSAETSELVAELASTGGIGNTHVSVTVLGDSIGNRNFSSGGPVWTSSSAIGIWNCANWIVGAPFVLAQNLAYSGDKVLGIFSRVSSVLSRCVFVMAGTNDVLAMSASADAATIASNYSTISGRISAGVASLVAAGKVVVISTILPNNAFTPNTDSRITLLDQLNAFISTLAITGKVFIVDGFTALWDSTQPTVRVAKSGALNADGTHPTSAGALLFGAAAKTAMRSAFSACVPDINIYAGFHQQRMLFNEFRRSTGGVAGTISAGSGTIADGWRCLQNAGTATFTVDATQAYSVTSDYIGPVATKPVSIDTYWQVFNITAAAASDNPRLRLPGNSDIISTATPLLEAICAGSEVFMEMDVEITSPVNLTEVSIGYQVFFTVGTSPVDQAWAGTTYVLTSAGQGTDSSSAATAIPASVRYLLRTPVHRVPENINGTVAITALPYADMKFGGTGSAVVKFGSPRLWHKPVLRV